MDLDFNLSAEVEKLRLNTRDFIDREILPLEADRVNFDDHENIRLDVLGAVRAKAKSVGLWAPQVPQDRGGLGLPVMGWVAIY